MSHTSSLGSYMRSYVKGSLHLSRQQGEMVDSAIEYQPDAAAGTPRSITNSGIARSYEYTASPDGNVLSVIEKVRGATSNNWIYTYDSADRLVSGEATVFGRFAYGYDQASNMISLRDSTGQRSFSYNSLNEIV